MSEVDTSGSPPLSSYARTMYRLVQTCAMCYALAGTDLSQAVSCPVLAEALRHHATRCPVLTWAACSIVLRTRYGVS
eukprot:2568086-Rhodomonas_salina.2